MLNLSSTMQLNNNNKGNKHETDKTPDQSSKKQSHNKTGIQGTVKQTRLQSSQFQSSTCRH